MSIFYMMYSTAAISDSRDLCICARSVSKMCENVVLLVFGCCDRIFGEYATVLTGLIVRRNCKKSAATDVHFVRFLLGKGRSEVAGESCLPLPDRSGAVWISGRVVRKGDV